LQQQQQHLRRIACAAMNTAEREMEAWQCTITLPPRARTASISSHLHWLSLLEVLALMQDVIIGVVVKQQQQQHQNNASH